ncbi:MAG TPA: FHA domain-containing protein [Blastocatellia bacterium]|nr:FHA domain-containing protein [Blastocatellia bacterium]
MAHAKLKIDSPGAPEFEAEIRGEASIGRAPDNLVCIDDRMVSAYHAVIEKRGEAFWLSDLGSRNGTTLNGEPVTAERRLKDGDSISVAGIAAIAFRSDEGSSQPQARYGEPRRESVSTATADDTVAERLPQAAPTPRASPLLIIAAAVIGIAVAGGAVMLVTGMVGGADGAVRVLSPETGSTIRGPQTIRVEAESPRDIGEITYLLDGVEFASAEHAPFEVTLDPAQLETKVRNLASGNHVLTLTVEDKKGNKKPQSETVLLAFDTSVATGDGVEVKTSGEEAKKESATPGARSGSTDVAALSRNLAAAISGKSWFDFDSQFADEIRNRTPSYRVNVMDDASRHRRQIGNAFNSKGLPPAIGFVMALSESRFKEDAATGPDQKIGFWQVPRQIALEQGYILPDESAADLKDVKRSAEIAASYINDLVNAFGGMDHFMYAIACYGMPLSQAAKVRARLEEIDPNATARKDFWRMVRSNVVPRDGADHVARFFAAGIVGENPQMFGLNSRPLSSLY